MNIYARYFDRDVLVYSYDELMDFLTSIPEIPINQRLADDVRTYVESDMPYPKRYKIRPRVYFILIKTTATTMEEFKSNRRTDERDNAPAAYENVGGGLDVQPPMNKKEMKAAALGEVREGWYRGAMTFKRVLLIPGTGKFRYQDTQFEAFVRARSGQECYDRMVDHLKNRREIDLRSQFPSARGSNFDFEYVGKELKQEA